MSRIRVATPDDAPVLAALYVDTWRAAYADFVPASVLDALSVGERAERYRARLAALDRASTDLVSLDDAGAVVGAVSFGPAREVPGVAAPLPADRVGEIQALNVHPSAWGGGHGRTLMEAAQGFLLAAGHGAAVLWAWEENRRARNFYERLGYAHDGTSVVSDRFGAPLAEMRYRRELAAPFPEPVESA